MPAQFRSSPARVKLAKSLPQKSFTYGPRLWRGLFLSGNQICESCRATTETTAHPDCYGERPSISVFRTLCREPAPQRSRCGCHMIQGRVQRRLINDYDAGHFDSMFEILCTDNFANFGERKFFVELRSYPPIPFRSSFACCSASLVACLALASGFC